jgi:TRAP-type C4-dicarboxylate transport system substrate-binding protein
LFFNKWPENVRKLFLEVASEAEKRSGAADTKAAEAGLEFMRTHGATVVDFSPAEQQKLQATVPNFIDVWVEQQEKAGRGDVARQIGDYIKKRRLELK